MKEINKYSYLNKASAFCILYLFGFFFFQIVATIVVQSTIPDKPLSFGTNFTLVHNLVFAWFCMLFILPLTILFYTKIDNFRLNETGFSGNIKNVFFQSFIGVLVAVGFYATYIVVLNNLNFIELRWKIPYKLGLIIPYALFMGLIEELAIRGYLLHVFIRKQKYMLGVLVSTIFFVIIHVFNPGITFVRLINLFLMGIFLALITIRAGNFYFAFLFHVSHYLFYTLLGFNYTLSENDFTLFTMEIIEGNELITGGKESISGSFLFTALLSIAILVMIGPVLRKINKVRS